MNDGELLKQYAFTASEAAFTQVMARHRAWVYSVAMRIIRDPHTAEDVTQAVFVLVAEKAKSLAGHPRLSGWLLLVVRNKAEHAIRARNRRTRREECAAMIRWQWAVRSSESEGWNRLADVLDDQVARLGRTDREAILLRFYQGKEMTEVGTTLGISEAAARKRVSRAVANLRDRLRDRTGRQVPIEALTAWMAQTLQPISPSVGSTQQSIARRTSPRKMITPTRLALMTGSIAAIVTVVVLAEQPSTAPRPGTPQAAPMAAAPVQQPVPPGPVTDLTGIVSGPDGAPVGNATVTVFPGDLDGGVPAPDAMRPSVRTDANGVFHIPPIDHPWMGLLIAQADGFGTASSGIVTMNHGQRVNIALTQPTDLTVTFHRPDGEPATGLPVYFVGAYWFDHRVQQPNAVCPDGRSKRFQATTNTNGTCTFKDLPRGSDAIWLKVRDDRYAQLDQENWIKLPEGEASVAATVVLTAATSISGRVTFGSNLKSVAGVGVQAFTLDGRRHADPVYSADDGTYTIKQLRANSQAVVLAPRLAFYLTGILRRVFEGSAFIFGAFTEQV